MGGRGVEDLVGEDFFFKFLTGPTYLPIPPPPLMRSYLGGK